MWPHVRLRSQPDSADAASAACQLVIAFTRSSIVVQSSCGSAGNTSDPHRPLAECPRDADDANRTSRLAGYCFNVTLPTPTQPAETAAAAATEISAAPMTTTSNTSFTAIVDTTVVEVFTGTVGGRSADPGPVISSGVFAGEGSASEDAVLEVFCEGGGGSAKATVDARSYLLGPPGN